MRIFLIYAYFCIVKERLNLTIDGDLLEAIKAYAASKEISVSELVESYFRRVTRPVQRKNILDMVDGLDVPASSMKNELPTADPLAPDEQPLQADQSTPSLAELEARIAAWASQPGPLTKVKKAKHGL